MNDNDAQDQRRRKQARRNLAWLYNGNAQVCDQMFKPVGHAALSHPNRVMEQFRSSLRGRKAG